MSRRPATPSPRKRRRRRRPRDYTEQTYASPYWIVRFPHEARYSAAVEAVAGHGARRVLDYGAGDGHLFVELGRSGRMPADVELVAFEPVAAFGPFIPREPEGVARPVRVVHRLEGLGDERFDVITCLGVLEHLPLPERQRFYRVCRRHLASDGIVVVDVPVEHGLSILVKEAGRILLKGRRPEVGARQLARLALGRVEFDAARFDPTSTESYIHHHAGFDHRLLRRELERHFRVHDSFPTPLRRVPAAFGNQEVFYVLGVEAPGGR
jgi:SAM-dependent methyltransferase